MKDFYLEKPNIERKEDAMEYLNEHVNFNNDLSGIGSLKKCLKDTSYEQWLDDIIKCENKEYAELKNLVPATWYFMIRKNDDKIIGLVNLRHYLDDYLKDVGGHIAYGIRPTERGKGYAKIQLYLTLIEAQKLGIDKVMIDCINTNIPSKKTILALGGKFDRKVYEEKRNITLNNYWIDVDNSIEKYCDEYESKINHY